jgi:hypothetical protein
MKKILFVLGFAFCLANAYGQGVGLSDVSSSTVGMYSNVYGDFTVTPVTDSSKVYLTGLAFTLDKKHLVGGSMYKIRSNNKLYRLAYKEFEVSGDTIEFTGLTKFNAGDSVYLFIHGDYPKGFNSSGEIEIKDKYPDYAHYTDTESFDGTNIADSSYVRIDMRSYKYLSLDVTLTAIELTVYATNDNSLSATDESGWQDVTSDIGGVATITTTGLYLWDTPVTFEYFLLKVKQTNATNEHDIGYRKTY